MRPPGPHRPLPPVITELLRLAGELYLPFLQANAAAGHAGEKTFEASLLGKPYAQPVFGYQIKCLNWLREELAGLDGAPAERTRMALEETGCWAALQG